MKNISKKIIVFMLGVFVLTPLFGMEDEKGDMTKGLIPQATPKNDLTRVLFIKGVLRSPDTKEEWDAYHKIRIAEIHNKYCPELVYDFEDPEEKLESNFGFIFVDTSRPQNKVLGVIRVDLLTGSEAAFRWVAITHELQRKGLGRRMLELAELFVTQQGRRLVHVPAEEDSRGFYEKLGYTYREWPDGPKDSGNVPLGKELK